MITLGSKPCRLTNVYKSVGHMVARVRVGMLHINTSVSHVSSTISAAVFFLPDATDTILWDNSFLWSKSFLANRLQCHKKIPTTLFWDQMRRETVLWEESSLNNAFDNKRAHCFLIETMLPNFYQYECFPLMKSVNKSGWKWVIAKVVKSYIKNKFQVIA